MSAFTIAQVFSQRLTVLFALLVGVIVAGSLSAADLHVPSQFSTIQSAINAATGGDRVVVAAGEYHENITLKSGVSVLGCGMDLCKIHGNGTSATVFANQLTAAATLDGFTITGGGGFIVPWSENRIMGGGIFADASIINIGNNHITANRAEYGGAIALLNSQFNIIANVISENKADKANAKASNMGGGIYLYNSVGEISSNAILHNEVNSGIYDPAAVANSNLAPGGGLAIIFDKNMGEVKILSNTISNNRATGSQFYGGGIYLYQPDPALKNQIYVMNNTINSNQGLDGGGLAIVQMSPVITGNQFRNNQAHWGGAIYGFNGAGLIQQNIFESNQALMVRPNALTGGGGILCDEDFTPTIAQNAFRQNSAVDYGGGLEIFDSNSDSLVWNNQFFSNKARIGAGMVASQASPAIIRNYFYKNEASQSGGGLFVEKQGNFDINNNIFSANTARNWGGGASLVGAAGININNNTFDANSTSDFWGGGLHTYAGSVSLSNNQFTNNVNFGVGIDGNSSVSREYNNFFANTRADCFQCPASATQLNTLPAYENTDTFSLISSSASVDRGSPEGSFRDRDGSRNDIGAYGGPAGGFIATPKLSFADMAAAGSKATYDAGTQSLRIPAVELGTHSGSFMLNLQLASCASAPGMSTLKLLNWQPVSSHQISQGDAYLDPYLQISSLVLGGADFRLSMAPIMCDADPGSIYLRLLAWALN